MNRHNLVEGIQNVFALGNVAYMEEENFPKGHPQDYITYDQSLRLLFGHLFLKRKK